MLNMIDAIKRFQLQRKGLSCGKKRREKSEGTLITALRYSPRIRWLIYVAFVAGAATLVWVSSESTSVFESEFGRAILAICLLTSVAVIHQRVAHRAAFKRNSVQFLIFALVFLQVALIPAVALLVKSNQGPPAFAFLLLPFALAPMTITILLGRSQGIFAGAFASLLGCLFVPEEKLFAFLVAGLLVGLVGAYLTHGARRRGAVVRAGFYSGLATVGLLYCLGLLPPFDLGGFTQVEWQATAVQVLAGILTGIFAGMLVSGCLPFLEALFNVTTDIGWVELSDLNHPLLKRMSIEAPGTYQHSLMVAHLAETAAECIGANATMCRASAYFHDIGKLNKPAYFIENASPENNPHDDLTPTMSALVLIAHVKDGVDLAIKHRLNKEILDVIEQHHGTSLVYFFYRKAIEARDAFKERVAEGKANEDDIPEVSKKNFRYPGPKPQFRECAVVSLADAVESASRTLLKPTPQKIEQLVEEIIRNRINEGQLDGSGLTLGELDVIKGSFASTLRSMMHTRIEYPKDESGDDREKDGGGGGGKSEARQLTEADGSRPKTERLSRPGARDSKKARIGNAA